MSLRRWFILSVLLLAGALLGPSAYAQAECGMLTPCEPDYYSWDTGGGGFQPPATTECAAYQSRDQRCRECFEAMNPNGTPKGYQTCGFVPRSAGCYCEDEYTSSCRSKGWCKYYAW